MGGPHSLNNFEKTSISCPYWDLNPGLSTLWPSRYTNYTPQAPFSVVENRNLKTKPTVALPAYTDTSEYSHIFPSTVTGCPEEPSPSS